MDKNTKFLIVDDFPTMRRIVKNQLADLGYARTVEADDGITALPILKAGGIKFVITDWNMPEMTGIELLRKIRADPAMATLPVLMVTAEASKDQIVEAAQAGVNGYLVKPFTAQNLKDKLERIMQRLQAAA